MIQYNPKAWFNLIFHSYSRHVLKTLTPVLIFMGVFTTIICVGLLSYLHASQAQFQGTSVVHSLLGIVLGLFLVFRTNSAYDRWWEGRKLWGGMVNSTRNLALKINAYLPKHYMTERTYFAAMIPNFIYATKEHLRRGVQFTELEEHEMLVMDDIKKVKHRPNKFASLIYERINELYRKNEFTGDHLINLDKEMKDLIDLMGACERIKNTPIPYS
jgi:putative membrane protein